MPLPIFVATEEFIITRYGIILYSRSSTSYTHIATIYSAICTFIFIYNVDIYIYIAFVAIIRLRSIIKYK